MYKNSIFLRLRNKNQIYIVDYFNDGFRLHLSGGKRPFLENLNRRRYRIFGKAFNNEIRNIHRSI
jgi:hypothetical protein